MRIVDGLWITRSRLPPIGHDSSVTRRPGELPPDLEKAAFTVEQGRNLGLTRQRMRADDLERPFRGVRQRTGMSHSDVDAPAEMYEAANDELSARCRAAELVIPRGAFFSHVTAAHLWPLPLPGLPNDGPVHVGVIPPEHPPRRAGVTGHHISDPAAFIVRRHGYALIDPATLFCELAAVLRLEDLVAVGDSLVLQPRYDDPGDDRPWLTMHELGERLDRFRGRGKLRAAQALDLVRPGAESRPESLVRLAILEAGLPEPEVNIEVFSRTGQFVGRADLLFRQYRLVVEYDGDQHRVDTVQFDRDVGRLDDFAAAGWRVVRITKRAFFGDRAGCIARIRQALIAAGWTG